MTIGEEAVPLLLIWWFQCRFRYRSRLDSAGCERGAFQQALAAPLSHQATSLCGRGAEGSRIRKRCCAGSCGSPRSGKCVRGEQLCLLLLLLLLLFVNGNIIIVIVIRWKIGTAFWVVSKPSHLFSGWRRLFFRLCTFIIISRISISINIS